MKKIYQAFSRMNEGMNEYTNDTRDSEHSLCCFAPHKKALALRIAGA